MKKLLAIGITTLGGFGLLGMAATSASAATPPSAHSIVCSSAASQLINLQTPLSAAGAAASATHITAGTDLSAVGIAEHAYVTNALKVVADVDLPATAAVQAADVLVFNASITDFVNAVVASSAANVADFNAQATLTQLNLQHTVLTGMQAGC